MTDAVSAGGFLALLDDDESALQVHALRRLNDVVDVFWAEISDSIEKIEVLYEDEEFPERKLAALVASKVFYHLGALDDAMAYALGAEELFDLSQKNEYIASLVSKCIDEYILLRSAAGNEEKEVDLRLEDIVKRMFARCFEEGGFKQALGIALESHREDMIKESILKAPNMLEMLEYCFNVCMTLVTLRDFRHTVFRILIELYQKMESPDLLNVCRILVFLDDTKQTAEVLHRLMTGNADDCLLAYQIAFDLVNNGSQQFRLLVRNLLPAPVEEGEDDDAPEGPAAMEVDESSSLLSGVAGRPGGADDFDVRNANVHRILKGESTILLHLEYLHQNNSADLGILKNTKSVLEPRNSITHGATIFANSTMNAGTTKDLFLRENLEWLAKATNWSKFSATAGLGVIHKGHIKEGLKLLRPYLPGAVKTSSYSEGGALYGLGLIHANHGDEISPYLQKALRDAGADEVVQHGACLGLGVAAMATGNEEVIEDLRNTLYLESSVAGEAAGLGMGLVMMGMGEEAGAVLQEMLEYARETEREKILRGLSVGVAMIMYGREEQADALIEQLTLDKDPILRYGGMYTIGLAYHGTSNNAATKKLLHFAISDVADDVRRAAVTCLGFVLSNQPEHCPEVVALLVGSYNAHVRYGSAMALGFACAGTAMASAIDLLMPLASDPEDYVRQGALIALAMVLIQTTAEQEPRVAEVRKLFADRIAEKRTRTLTKFGAIVGQGIIDAGGRNVTIAQHSLSGHKNMMSAAGLAVFAQYWHWYPLVHFISLAFTPTVVIGLNHDLRLPVWSFTSKAKPSLFALPKEVKPPTTAAPVKVATAVLSTTRKAKQRAAKKDKPEGDPMDVSADAAPAENAEGEKESKAEGEEGKKSPKQPEPTSEEKQNPARVVVAQLPFLCVSDDSRYQPITSGKLFGITLLKDTRPGEPEKFVQDEKEGVSKSNASESAPIAELQQQNDEEEPEAPPSFDFAG